MSLMLTTGPYATLLVVAYQRRILANNNNKKLSLTGIYYYLQSSGSFHFSTSSTFTIFLLGMIISASLQNAVNKSQ